MLADRGAASCILQAQVCSRYRKWYIGNSGGPGTGSYEVKLGETKVLHLGQVTGMDPGDGFSDLKNGEWSQVWWGSYFSYQHSGSRGK